MGRIIQISMFKMTGSGPHRAQDNLEASLQNFMVAQCTSLCRTSFL